MTKDNIQFCIERFKSSYDYKFDKNKNDFANNIKNNKKDILTLKVDDMVVFYSFCQSVANHPQMKFQDTIAAGNFALRAFVDPRSFHGEIHGIINARDIEGDKIGPCSMQVENGFQKGRWLMHDMWSFKHNRDLNNAYSGGCIMMRSDELIRINSILKAAGVQKGDEIPVRLWEV